MHVVACPSITIIHSKTPSGVVPTSLVTHALLTQRLGLHCQLTWAGSSTVAFVLVTSIGHCIALLWACLPVKVLLTAWHLLSTIGFLSRWHIYAIIQLWLRTDSLTAFAACASRVPAFSCSGRRCQSASVFLVASLAPTLMDSRLAETCVLIALLCLASLSALMYATLRITRHCLPNSARSLRSILLRASLLYGAFVWIPLRSFVAKSTTATLSSCVSILSKLAVSAMLGSFARHPPL